MGVRHRLERRKSFRRDDEQGFRRIEVPYRFSEVGSINVGDEAKTHVALGVVLERFVGHDRPEIGAANPDVDDVTNAVFGMAFPRLAPYPVGGSRQFLWCR